MQGQAEERLGVAYNELKQGVLELGGVISKESLVRR